MAKPAQKVEMKPFLFERTFDDRGNDLTAKKKAEEEKAAKESEEAVPAEPEVEVIYTEEDLAAAKQESYMEGHADGFREGHAESMDTLERQLNDLLERLAPLVSELGGVQREANERAQANMARIVQELMTKIMPIYIRKHGCDEALAVVSECLSELQDPGRLTIHLAEETADLLGDRLNKAAQRAGFEGQIRLLTDEELGPSDVRVDWGAGGAERHYDSIKTAIDAAIDRAVARIEAGLAEEEELAAPHRETAEDGDAELAESELESEAGVDAADETLDDTGMTTGPEPAKE
ncbi:hypothetical protein [Pacificispira sp.]|uniref:hypothetical protein n=1 Tax=Pacificispira sp. TaxID=2888761 RepID=UPI003B51878D